MGQDDNDLFGVQDTNEEEEYSDLTGGNVDGATGLTDVLHNDDYVAIDTGFMIRSVTSIEYKSAYIYSKIY